MTFDKGGNNSKKLEKILVFTRNQTQSRSSTTFKMELFATVGNGRAYNQWIVVFARCCGISTILTGKIKIQ